MQILTGEGIFAPSPTDTALPTNAFEIDLAANTVYVEGCSQPDFLSSRPFGIINFAYVLLPDYVTDTDPVEVYAYSDNAYSDLVFVESKEDGGGLGVTREMLQPGQLELVAFKPSNFYAFVKDVTYELQIAPSHDMLPSTRVVISMPETLAFDAAEGCTVTYTEAICDYDAATHEMTLTEVFKERTPGGTLLKFYISYGDNPIGARYAGDWGARTEGVYDGEYFIVDGNADGYSFYAEPGYIKSSLDYEAALTFSEESTLDFTFETEHRTPIGGFLKVTLPVEMAFPDSAVDSQSPELTIGRIVTPPAGGEAG